MITCHYATVLEKNLTTTYHANLAHHNAAVHKKHVTVGELLIIIQTYPHITCQGW